MHHKGKEMRTKLIVQKQRESLLNWSVMFCDKKVMRLTYQLCWGGMLYYLVKHDIQ